MFVTLVVQVMEAVVIGLIAMMIRRMFSLYRTRTPAREPEAPADPTVTEPLAELGLSSARVVVAPHPSSPARQPTTTMLQSYIDELLGGTGEALTANGSESPPAKVRLKPSVSRPPPSSIARSKPSYQPIANILTKRCDAE
jgi:hypothetical protein